VTPDVLAPIPRAPLAVAAPARLRVLDGPRAFFGGVGFVVGTPSVWPLAMVPVAILFVLGAGSAALGLFATWHLVSWIVSGASAWATVGRFLLELVFGGIALIVSALVALAFAQPLSARALEAISHRQAVALGVAAPSERSPILRSLAVNLLGLAVGLPLFALLAIVDLAFPPAGVVTWPLRFVLYALLFAWDMLDYPLGLRGATLGDRLRFFGRNFFSLLLFGIFAAPFLLVPGLGLFLLPFGVAGATRLIARSHEPARS